MNPWVELNQVSILDKNSHSPKLHIEKIRVTIKLAESLSHRKLIIDHWTVTGSHVVIRQRADHRFEVNDIQLPMLFANQESDAFIQWTDSPFHFSNIDLTYLGMGKTALALHHLEIKGNRHRAMISSQQLTADLPSISAKRFLFNNPSLDVAISDDLNHYAVTVNLKPTIHAQFLMDYSNHQNHQLTINTATIDYNQSHWSIKNNHGLVIDGTIPQADLADLLPLMSNSQAVQNHRASPFAITISKLNIAFDHLDVAGYPLNKTLITAEPRRHAWLVNITSQDVIGKITLSNGLRKQRIHIDFKRFSLKSKLLNQLKQSTQSTFAIKPSQIPSLDMHFKAIYYDKENLGRIHLVTTHQANALIIQSLSIKNKNITLAMTGRWSGYNQQHSLLSGHIITNNLGDFLQDWKISNSLQGAKGTLNFKLQWQGPIYDINLAKLNGQMDFSLSNGVILDLANNNLETVGRILNIISIDSLEFLLSKPFGIIAPKQKGFEFEVEKANVNIVNGALYSDNFYLKGKLAEVKSQGQIGLAKRNYNLYVTITPYLTAYLPMSLSLAGGPVTYSLVWTANKFMGGLFNGFFRQIYHVTGSWQHPIYQKVSSVGALGQIPPSRYKN